MRIVLNEGVFAEGVIGRTVGDSHDPKILLIFAPVHPASSPAALAREARACEAAQTRAWRIQHALAAVPVGYETPRWRS